MISYGKPKRSVFVVYHESLKNEAEMAKTLFSMRTDVKCQSMLYKEYTQNGSSDNICIFIGDISEIKLSRNLVPQKKYDRGYGIRYGWTGNKAFIWLENTYLSSEEINKMKAEYEDSLNEMKKYNIGDFAWDVLTTYAFGVIGLTVKKGTEFFLAKNEEKKMAMDLGILKFMNNDFDNFFNEAIQ